MKSNNDKNRAAKNKVLRATDSHFRNVTSYKTYWLLNLSQIYNGMMASRKGSYAKRIETLVKLYKLVDKKSIPTFVSRRCSRELATLMEFLKVRLYGLCHLLSNIDLLLV